MLRKLASAVGVVAVVGMSISACSSDPDPVTPVSDSGVGEDGGIITVTKDAQVLPPMDTGPVCASSPTAAAAYVPGSTYHGAVRTPGACPNPDTFASGYITACTGSTGSDAACKAFQDANAACFACAVSLKTDKIWGALVQDAETGTLYLNVAGCFELKGGNSVGKACASARQDSQDCPIAACAGGCPIDKTDSDSLAASAAARSACAKSTDAKTACKKYTDLVSTACAPIATYPDAGTGTDAGPQVIADCLNGTATFQTFFPKLVAIFCQ